MIISDFRILYRIVLIISFSFCTVGPLVGGLLTGDNKIATVEKRKLNKLPPIPITMKSLRDYPGNFEDYYNDNFGFRNTLNSIYSYIKFKIGDSSSKKVIRGKGEWLFYNERVSDPVGDYRNINIFSEKELRAYKDKLYKKGEFLKSKGIEYVFIVAPNKHTIYSEFLPSYLNKMSDKSAYDQFIESIFGETCINVVDLRESLLAGKISKFPLYFKTDTHWNFTGTNIVQYEIAKVLEQIFPEKIRPVYYGSDKFKSRIRKGGDLASLIGLSEVLTEEFQAPDVNFCARRNGSEPIAFRQTFSTTCEKAKLRGLVFRDSFFTALQPFFSEYFNHVTYVWHELTLDELESYVSKESPDVVIEEVVERNFR